MGIYRLDLFQLHCSGFSCPVSYKRICEVAPAEVKIESRVCIHKTDHNPYSKACLIVLLSIRLWIELGCEIISWSKPITSFQFKNVNNAILAKTWSRREINSKVTISLNFPLNLVSPRSNLRGKRARIRKTAI